MLDYPFSAKISISVYRWSDDTCVFRFNILRGSEKVLIKKILCLGFVVDP